MLALDMRLCQMSIPDHFPIAGLLYSYGLLNFKGHDC